MDLPGRGRRAVACHPLQKDIQAHLAKILKNDSAQTGDKTDQDVIGYPFSCRPDAGGSQLRSEVIDPSFQRNCLLAQCLILDGSLFENEYPLSDRQSLDYTIDEMCASK